MSSILTTTAPTASFDSSTHQLTLDSHHSISLPISYLASFPSSSHQLIFTTPPSNPYQQSIHSDDIVGDETRPRKKRRKGEGKQREDLTPLDHYHSRLSGSNKSNTDLETEQWHESIKDRLEEAIESIKSGMHGRDWLGNEDEEDVGDELRSRVVWMDKHAEGKEEGIKEEIDWVNVTDVDDPPLSEAIRVVNSNTALAKRSLHNKIIWNDSKTKLIELQLTRLKDEEDGDESGVEVTLLLPPSAAFLLQDFRRWSSSKGSPSVLQRFGAQMGGWDLIIIDPPWPNSSAARSSSYDTFDPYSLGSLNMSSILNSKASTRPTLIVVWLTNKIKFRRLVTSQLLPSWGVPTAQQASWYWVKSTSQGEPVWSLSSTHRRTYEPLVLGYSLPSKWNRVRYPLPVLPKEKVFMGCPIGHSRKPVLWDLLKDYLPLRSDADEALGDSGRNVLELFGRTAVKGPDAGKGVWLSVGNEACKFNVVENDKIKGWIAKRDNLGADEICEPKQEQADEEP